MLIPGITESLATNILQSLSVVTPKFDPLTGEIIEN